jgi:hypothetical protein
LWLCFTLGRYGKKKISPALAWFRVSLHILRYMVELLFQKMTKLNRPRIFVWPSQLFSYAVIGFYSLSLDFINDAAFFFWAQTLIKFFFIAGQSNTMLRVSCKVELPCQKPLFSIHDMPCKRWHDVCPSSWAGSLPWEILDKIPQLKFIIMSNEHCLLERPIPETAPLVWEKDMVIAKPQCEFLVSNAVSEFCTKMWSIVFVYWGEVGGGREDWVKWASEWALPT